jgi:hypothetical protein
LAPVEVSSFRRLPMPDMRHRRCLVQSACRWHCSLCWVAPGSTLTNRIG